MLSWHPSPHTLLQVYAASGGAEGAGGEDEDLGEHDEL